MDVVVDLFADGSGKLKVESYDMPNLEETSARFPYVSANLSVGDRADTSAASTLVLRGAAVWPEATQIVEGPVPTRYIYLYLPRDHRAMIDFEHSIQPRYNDYYRDHGVRYAGLFDVDGLDEPYVAEILSFDRPLAAAKDFVTTHKPAADVADIEERCRRLQNRDEPRYLLWLY